MMNKHRRLESNEEIMLAALEKRGFLDMRIMFQVRDKDGTWRSLSGRTISARKIPNQGKLWQLVKKVFDSLFSVPAS
jgi:hypothetical protein